MFVDDYIHLGFDEVQPDCYSNNSAVAEWMAGQGMAAGDFKAVIRYLLKDTQAMVLAVGRKPIFWYGIQFLVWHGNIQ